jgi:DNA mismatch endonuclease, patch repair protein
MPDIFTKAKRSAVMARIKSRGNKDTELVLAKLFREHKITGWRRHWEIRGRAVLPHRRARGKAAQQRRPTGKFSVRPDFVFKAARLAVFVDGCFWHGCPRHATQPKSNRAFWRDKLLGNRRRDRNQSRTLRRAGWRVVRIWECALRRSPARCLARVQRALAGH